MQPEVPGCTIPTTILGHKSGFHFGFCTAELCCPEHPLLRTAAWRMAYCIGQALERHRRRSDLYEASFTWRSALWQRDLDTFRDSVPISKARTDKPILPTRRQVFLAFLISTLLSAEPAAAHRDLLQAVSGATSALDESNTRYRPEHARLTRACRHDQHLWDQQRPWTSLSGWPASYKHILWH